MSKLKRKHLTTTDIDVIHRWIEIFSWLKMARNPARKVWIQNRFVISDLAFSFKWYQSRKFIPIEILARVLYCALLNFWCWGVFKKKKSKLVLERIYPRIYFDKLCKGYIQLYHMYTYTNKHTPFLRNQCYCVFARKRL